MSDEKRKSTKKTVQKYNLSDVDDLWDSVLAKGQDENGDDDSDIDSILYGDDYAGAPSGDEQYSDAGGDQYAEEDLVGYDNLDYASEDRGTVETVPDQDEREDHLSVETVADNFEADEPVSEERGVEEAEDVLPVIEEFTASLEFIGGQQQEVARLRLFQPLENTVLLIDEETDDELAVYIEQFVCLRLSGLPARSSARRDGPGVKEIVETIDGRISQVFVPAGQDLSGFLVCFAEGDQERFPVILFPKSSIRKRCQDKPLVDILLEKRLISRSILQKAQAEFAELKGMSFDKIISQRARVPLADIEAALENARQNQMMGLQTGEILLIFGVVNEEQVLDAIDYHEHVRNMELEQYLIEKGFVREVEVYVALAEKHRIPFIDLRQRNIPRESLALLPESMLVRHQILPLVKKDDALLVAACSVDTEPLSDEICRVTGCKQVKFVLTMPSQLRQIINQAFSQGA